MQDYLPFVFMTNFFKKDCYLLDSTLNKLLVTLMH